MAIIAYAQLVAENAAYTGMPLEVVSTIFHLLISDLSSSALALASQSHLTDVSGILFDRAVAIPRTTDAEWNFVLQRARNAIAEVTA
jgi:hypothetical protein